MIKQTVLDMVPFIGKENKAREIVIKEIVDIKPGRKGGDVKRAGHAPTRGS